MARSTLLVAMVSALISPARAAGPGSSAVEQFEKQVRPLLVEHCLRCHGAEKSRGGLRLDSAAGLAEGGDTGPVIVPGKPDESSLIEAVKYAGDIRMPPKGKLSDAEIAALVDWTRNGAPWGESSVPPPAERPRAAAAQPIDESAKEHWAFQPVRRPPPPTVADNAWPRTTIDRFILAGLESQGFRPAPPADKRSLIRRATFDLIGLPPTPEEVQAFLKDDSPEAFARVIDRLLASSRYGERWARHWLDLARYADSNGMDENVAYANAWRYRDYVIGSFNADKPYDQFVKEQIAGDLLPAEDDATRHEQITGTGFLVLGPKMLAEDDPVKMEMDIIDEQVDTVGKVFMGLTLGCARCHDHKFDPIPTTDYYALAGIFKSTRSMANHKVVAMWNERPLASAEESAALEAHKRAVAAKDGAVKKVMNEARKALQQDVRSHVGDYLLAARDWRRGRAFRSPLLGREDGTGIDGALVREAESFDRGNVIVDQKSHGAGIGVILNGGPTPNHAEYDFVVPSAGIFQVEVRYAAAEPRPIRVLCQGVLLSDQVASEATGSWGPEHQRWTVAGTVRLEAGPAPLRIERTDGPIPHLDKIALVPRELPDGLDIEALQVASDSLARARKLNPRLLDRWVATLDKAEKDPSSIFRPWLEGGDAALGRTFESRFEQADQADPEALQAEPELAAFRRVLDDPEGPFALPRMLDALYAPETVERLDQLRAEIKALEEQAPPIVEVMGVEDQKAVDLQVHIRGSHLTLGEIAPRRFLRVIAGEDQAPFGSDRSGRLELAEWLTGPDHPLTSRVIVNRLWQWHFGQGLVRSPDNFGRLGEPPTHPELLDWLASELIASNWSLKAMHRRMMLSSAYQMSTRHDESAALKDPENRWHWRFDRHRLEAEAIRDALLAVSGELGTTMGGTRLPTKNHEYVSSTVKREAKTLYEVSLRSIYLPVIRSGLYPMFQAFDIADPSTSSGQRIPTTVAPQALFMLNDTTVLRTSAAWARRLLDRADLSDGERVRVAYERAYCRPASDEEVARALDYLERFRSFVAGQPNPSGDPNETAWRALCQALMAASEFITID